MKPYTKVYMDFFGYDIASFIPCEICGAKSVDIAHIWAKSIRKDLINDINNLQALCRTCHTKYGDKKQHRALLQEIHDNHLKQAKQ